MLLLSDLAADAVTGLLRKYGLSIKTVPDGHSINGSFWGEPEAGIAGDRVFVRRDTPLHSLLHEACHVVCMTPERRMQMSVDAGGGDLEECAVCYLQIVLADEIPEAGRSRLMQDMDDWGYSIRLGSAQRWFEEDAADARDWLRRSDILGADERPTFRLRQT
ncbi:MAG: hypothetical protein ACE5OQ_07805 [Woeseia sp.]